MAKVNRENFILKMILDRPQRKILDDILYKCNLAIKKALTESLYRLEDLKKITSLQGFEDLMDVPDICSTDISSITRKELARAACEKMSSVVAGKIDKKNRRQKTMVCVLDPKDVIFSSLDTTARIPYLGVVKFRQNQFVFQDIDGYITSNKRLIKIYLGYRYNEPALMLMTQSEEHPKPTDEILSSQNLVKVDRSKFKKIK